jgi:hypothetical protein
MIARLVRLILAAMFIASTLAQFRVADAGAEATAKSWTEPAGAYTVQWQEPWVVQRQEPGLLLVANGSIAAVATTSVPSAEFNPGQCLDAYVDATASPDVKAQQPFMEGRTSWRAYAAYENFQIGAVDYFECQVTPDGTSLALFLGGSTLMEKYGAIPMLIDFLGQWVVRPEGEDAPVVAGDGWRLGVVDWVRGSVYADLGLEPQPAGTDYLVVVADLANWQGSGTALPLESIAAVASSSETAIPVDIEASRTVADYLGEEPVEQTITLDPGTSRRIVLVFSVESAADDMGISIAGNAAVLDEDNVAARLVVLPSPSQLPATHSGVISNVIDGRTLLVTMSDTGQSERVRLIGVGAPRGIPAQQLLSSYEGQTVLLERDPAYPDDQRLQRYVWVTDSARTPVMLNDLLVGQGLAAYDASGTGGRFDAMIEMADGVVASGAGIEDQVPVMTVGPDTLPPTVPTETEVPYLTELARYRDSLRLSLEYYDQFMANPTMDAEFYGHLGITVLGWAVFYDGIVQLQPPIRFGGLHDRLISAFEPFDLLAHQIEPELDLILSGGTPQQQFAGFDYDVMTQTVDAARPELEAVLAMIDAELARSGITSEGMVTQ